MSDFKSLNLIAPILEALENKGYTEPTPIQAQAIPHLLEGKDLLGIAQTGTGKTAAFALPILHNLAKTRCKVNPKSMRVLILTPTRELASQIADNIKVYGKALGFKHIVIFGGVGENPQITAMSKGLEIVIATPGRLLDLTQQGYIKYDQLEVFVLDEADRMLDMGFINDIRRIIKLLPEKRQTLLFSATMPNDIASLANSILRDPVRVEVTPQSTTVEKIAQRVCFVEKGNKPMLLKHILETEDVKAALVFCRMKHGANKVEEYLQKNGIKAAAIHGNKTQGARERALKSFRDGDVRVLVATDIAARGIDIPLVSHVINFDIPQEPEAYVHRIGRTARAGREGVAISFCDPLERVMLRAVEKIIKRSIPVDGAHPFEGVEGEVVHRKISSGKKIGGEGKTGHSASPHTPTRISGSRIFTAKRADENADPRYEPPSEQRRERDDRRPSSRDRDNNNDRRNAPRSRNDSDLARPAPRNNRDRNAAPSSEGARTNTSRDAKKSGSGFASKYQSRKHPNSANRFGKAAGAKATSSNSDRRKSHGGKSSGSITSKLGKIVNWFSKKDK